MAAVRSAMVRLSRRSRVSGSSAAAPMGGRVMEIPQVVRPAAPGPPPPLRHAAIGNLENWQRFSTGRECADPKKPPLMKDNAEGILHLLGRWSNPKEKELGLEFMGYSWDQNGKLSSFKLSDDTHKKRTRTGLQ